jgi:uncharacterized protein (DUF2062 family)
MPYTSDHAKAALEGAYDWETQLEREVDAFLRNPVPTTAPGVPATPNRRYTPRRKAIAAALAIGFVLFIAMPYQLIGALLGLVLSITVVAAVIATPVYLFIKIVRRERKSS